MDKMDKMDKARRVLSGSAASALAALLMVGAIAFGSTVIRPMTINHEPEATTAQADDGSAGSDASATEPLNGTGFAPGSEQAGAADADKESSDTEQLPDWKAANPPVEEPKDEQPKTEPKDEPKDDPKPDPAPSTNLTLVAVFNADKGKIVVEWSAYTGDFEKYKLVRSTDADATWPLGEGDELVGVIGPDDQTRFVDANAPCNAELHYRVFAVRHSGDGYQVLASSNVGAAIRACSEEPPVEPVALGLDVAQTAEGVQLAWQPCSADGFVVYKVVRSATNADPKYPLNDGTELIGVIDNAATTGFTDSNVEAGQTWTYRVLCMGQNGDGWIVLGLTAALSVTLE